MLELLYLQQVPNIKLRRRFFFSIVLQPWVSRSANVIGLFRFYLVCLAHRSYRALICFTIYYGSLYSLSGAALVLIIYSYVSGFFTGPNIIIYHGICPW